MKVHELLQGSPEWLAYRREHFNASDAPAMMGCSPYKTREQLLRELHTGLAGEVDAGTQRRFDDGHRFEALARPMAEAIIGEELYPVTGSLGLYSASFDGLTLGGEVAFEHKTLNQELRECMEGEDEANRLPLHYRVQMEQQLMVSGAHRVIFMASKWDGDKCVESRHCWYYSDPLLREKIVAGWQQFERDLAAYVPPESAEPAKADTLEHLPAVSVRMDGALSVASNLPAFAEALRAFVKRIPERPTTDNEFATCDAACKSLKKAEEALDAAEAGALASITDVEAMLRTMADCRKLARETRLAAEKLVARRKVEIKEHAVAKARADLDKHVAALNAEIAPMMLRPVSVDWAGAIKGQKTIDSVRDRLGVALAQAKIDTDAQAKAIRDNIAAFKSQADGFEFLFSDLGVIVHKAGDDFAALVQSRIAVHRAAEAEKERRRQEAEAARIAAAEQRAREQEAARIAAQQAEDARVAALAQRREQDAADESARVAAAALAAAAAPSPVLSDKPVADANARAFVAAVSEPATLKLGAICERLGVTMTAAFVSDTLGVKPAKVEGASKLYRPSDFARICKALESHASAMRELYSAVSA